ncbi:TetR/AcrR family transcriptional regulator [Saccharomonospora sp. CUA-673]|uniref:TetR/AcrR family transcriptional regulator n=1 Tax=Saccharomonospora sp. CUA-673 TaxID=1904969 RepID=UPI001301264A|nr:TetR/AcrR family transcriptional regulator [Saccharomonospora sp. CUA-673]
MSGSAEDPAPEQRASEHGAAARDSEPRARGARRRARTRTAILDAAEQALADAPDLNVRIEEVAERAGVSAATIYLHFGTKDALIAATMQRLLEVAMEDLTAAYAAEGTPAEQVVAAGATYLQLLVDHPALVRYLCTAGTRETATAFDVEVDERIEELRAAFEARIQAAVDAGQAAPLDARLMSFFLFGAWNGVAALALGGARARLSPEDVVAVVQQGTQVLAAGGLAQSVGE